MINSQKGKNYHEVRAALNKYLTNNLVMSKVSQNSYISTPDTPPSIAESSQSHTKPHTPSENEQRSKHKLAKPNPVIRLDLKEQRQRSPYQG